MASMSCLSSVNLHSMNQRRGGGGGGREEEERTRNRREEEDPLIINVQVIRWDPPLGNLWLNSLKNLVLWRY